MVDRRERVYGITLGIFILGPIVIWLLGAALGWWWGPPNKLVALLVIVGWLIVLLPFALTFRWLLGLK